MPSPPSASFLHFQLAPPTLDVDVDVDGMVSTVTDAALRGSLDPTTGIFYDSPERARVRRTPLACDRCRVRKAKVRPTPTHTLGQHPAPCALTRRDSAAATIPCVHAVAPRTCRAIIPGTHHGGSAVRRRVALRMRGSRRRRRTDGWTGRRVAERLGVDHRTPRAHSEPRPTPSLPSDPSCLSTTVVPVSQTSPLRP